MKILGIDPGTTHSAGAVYDVTQHSIEDVFWVKNEDFVSRAYSVLPTPENLTIFYERMQHYTLTDGGVGNSTFRTCCWYGRFIESFFHLYGTKLKVHSITSPDVKLALLNLSNPSNAKVLVKRAIWELFPMVGGGSTPAIGTKTKPGPLYIMRGQPIHCWDSIAIAIVGSLWLQGKFTGDILQEEPSGI